VVRNPETHAVIRDKNGQVKLRHSDQEIRFESPDPFPLFPGESLVGKVTPLQVVAPNTAIRLRAIRDYKEYKAGDEWLHKGPGTYYPAVEVQVVEITKAIIIKPNQAVRLKARKNTHDSDGQPRKAGEEWLVRMEGAYLPDVHEEVRETISAYVLTEKKALHLTAITTFTDNLKKERKAGEQWLVTLREAETHIPDVYERVVGEVPITTLTSRQYCVVVDPVDDHGRNQLGKRELRIGEGSFFLRPGERLENGIQNVHVLEDDEALLLSARERFEDGKATRQPGERWMIKGPCDYVPNINVDIIEKRRSIPLDQNEGIYVRDIKSGQVRAITAEAYLLKENEELWEKIIPSVVEELLLKDVSRDRTEGRKEVSRAPTIRDKTKVITYRTPHNSAVQIYDYKSKKSRVVYGPDLVMLGPDEQFTIQSLSGEIPKRAHVIKSLCLLLGPDFMTDVVVVETSDHARLSLKLSYNWHFEYDPHDAKKSAAIFSVPDFVGDACKAIASRVRGIVAAHSFDNFHKGSAQIIREAVFGTDIEGKPLNRFVFSANNLVITNIDIQSVEPVDSRTRDALQKSVQLAIEITTKSQEAEARQEAERREQQARGRLERQKIQDEAEAEKSRRSLLELQAASAAVESTGQATAEAKARAQAADIEGKAAVKQAELSSEADSIKSTSLLQQKIASQAAALAHQQALDDLEITKAKDLAEIESEKFKSIVEAIGAETLATIAQAGPEMQTKLLSGLGLKSFLLTDSNSPLNIFNQ